MFDHVTIHVLDRDESERFFETVLTPIGIESTYRTNTFAVWDEFYVTHADAEHLVTTGLHVGFSVSSREQVDAFWQAGIDAGYTDDGAPGPRPQSEAAKTAALPTSSSVVPRLSIVLAMVASEICWRRSKLSGMVSRMPLVWSVTTRMPFGPSSTASARRRASAAPNAT